MKVPWWMPVLTGALFGFGAATGVVCFLVMTDTSLVMYRWIRQRVYRLENWRKRLLPRKGSIS